MTKTVAYLFGPFRLDLTEELLFCDGVEVALQRKTFKTLVLLVENRGRLVEKQKFFDEIWGDAEVEDGSLTVNISLLRKTLGDGQKGQKFIETVPLRGYRFVAPVRVEDVIATTGSPPVETSATQLDTLIKAPQAEDKPRPLPGVQNSAETARPAAWRRSVLMGAGSAIFLILALGLWRWMHPPRPDTLAVLPFRNLKPDAQTDFLSYSLAEEITTKLGGVRLPNITIAPTVYRGAQLAAEPPETDLQLSGNYLKRDDGLQITIRLIRTRSNEMLWQEPIEVREADLPFLLDQAARRVMAKLGAQLTEAQDKLLKDERAKDPIAYIYYLEGLFYYKEEDFSAAIGMLKKATEREPGYARAWELLGSAHAVRASTRSGGREDYDLAETAFQKAITLNPWQPRPHIFLANLLTETNRVEQAVPKLRELLARHPEHALAQWELSNAYRYGGLLKESIEWGERALAGDPSFRVISPVLITYLYVEDYRKFLDSLTTLKDRAYVNFYRGFAQYYSKDYMNARTAFERAYELDPSLLQACVGKALSEGLAEQPASGLTLIAKSEAKIIDRGVADAEGIYKLAQAYAVLGDKVGALRLMRKSIEGGFFCYPYMMKDSLLANLHGEPEFTTLLETARQRHEVFKHRFLTGP